MSKIILSSRIQPNNRTQKAMSVPLLPFFFTAFSLDIQVRECISHIKPGIGILRIDPDGLVESLDSLFIVVLPAKSDTL